MAESTEREGQEEDEEDQYNELMLLRIQQDGDDLLSTLNCQAETIEKLVLENVELKAELHRLLSGQEVRNV